MIALRNELLSKWRKTVGEDKIYDTADSLQRMLRMMSTSHLAQDYTKCPSAIEGGTFQIVAHLEPAVME